MTTLKDETATGEEVAMTEIIASACKFKELKDNPGLIKFLSPYARSYQDSVLINGVLGVAYLEESEYESAQKLLAPLIASDRAPHWVYVEYANALERQKKHVEAAEFFRRGLNIQYSRELACRIAKLVKYAKDPNEFYDVFVAMIYQYFEEDDELAKEFYEIARFLDKKGYDDKVVDFYLEAVRRDECVKLYHQRMIVALVRSKEFTEARNALKKLKKLGISSNGIFGLEKIVEYRAEVEPYLGNLESIFLGEYYRRENGLEQLSNDKAFRHFLSIGMSTELNPNPWFDHKYFLENYSQLVKKNEIPVVAYLRLEISGLVKPSEWFDPVFYRRKYIDLKDLPVTLGHYVKYGHLEGRLSHKSSLPEALISEFEEMIDFEPKLVSGRAGLQRIVRYPRVKTSMFVPGIVSKKVQSQIKAIVCVPFVSRGGADLVATYCMKALQEKHGVEAVLLIVTDSQSVEVPSWLDENTQFLLLENEARFVDIHDKVDTLHKVIGQFQPSLILNINSKACWEMYKTYGKQLSTVASLNAYLFCYDYDSERNRVGYITEYLSETIEYLAAVLVDNKHISEDIKERYRFSSGSANKIHPIYSPYFGQKDDYMPGIDRNSVLWIGRMSVQKRPDILVKIAQAMPTLNFYVYGTPGDSEHSQKIVSGKYKNIHYKGTFTDISELKLNKYTMFLHNSEWEGIPTVLITMMANSKPIVTSDVGGVGELVNEQTGWVVKNFESVDEYCVNISRILLSPESAREKAECGFDLVEKRHRWENYISELESVNILTKDLLKQNVTSREIA